MLMVPALGRQEDCEFEASLVYLASSRKSCTTKQDYNIVFKSDWSSHFHVISDTTFVNIS
jgi:hypothetical protein